MVLKWASDGQTNCQTPPAAILTVRFWELLKCWPIPSVRPSVISRYIWQYDGRGGGVYGLSDGQSHVETNFAELLSVAGFVRLQLFVASFNSLQLKLLMIFFSDYRLQFFRFFLLTTVLLQFFCVYSLLGKNIKLAQYAILSGSLTFLDKLKLELINQNGISNCQIIYEVGLKG